MRLYRQGDVLLAPLPLKVTGLPEAVGDARGRIVLAYGEATGHAHVVEGATVHAFRLNDSALDAPDILVVGDEGAELRHETEAGERADHAPIALPAGTYRVLRQREYAGDDDAPVWD